MSLLNLSTMSGANVSRLVPADFLVSASCLLPERKPLMSTAATSKDNREEVLRPDDGVGSNLNRLLSPTESRVLPLVLAGLADKEIASVLGRSLPTVKHHVGAILRKHRVTSRARLMAVLREAADGKPEPALLRHFGT